MPRIHFMTFPSLESCEVAENAGHFPRSNSVCEDEF